MYRGSGGGLVPLWSSTQEYGFGVHLATGDINCDSVPDLVATNGGYFGHAYVYLGNGGTFPATASYSDANLPGSIHGESFGGSATAGDFNGDNSAAVAGGDTDGDGYLEVLVGAPGEDTGGAEAGAVYLYELAPPPN